jgi:universal stress protein A
MIQLFKKVLCPIDFSEHSLAALDVALRIAQQNGAALCLVNVVILPPAAGPVQAVPTEPYPDLEKESHEQLVELARKRIPATVRYETLVVNGWPGEAVLKAARDLDADIIVMGTHGRTGLSHLVLGSVAEQVVRESQIPVLTAHSRARVREAALAADAVLPFSVAATIPALQRPPVC